MGRLNTMADTLNSTTLVSGVTYGVANQIQQITSGNTSAVNNETRAYNNLFQLTQLTVGSAINRTYAFPAPGLNNGKLVSQTDALSGETVVYTYDMLNRLSSAQTSAGSPQWGQSYGYDGFGNLTDQNVTLGSAPSMHVTYNAANNRQSSPVADTADANGNILGSPYSYLQNIFDIDNRLVQPGNNATIAYSYDAGNKRIWRGDSSAGLDELDFFAGNQKLATYQISSDSGAIYFTLKTTNVYFGGKLVSKGTASAFGADHLVLSPIAADRLGSIGKFYPYGQERPSATTNDTEKFTSYFRDQATGLDYADQRYHQPGVGRFITPDPSAGNVSYINPLSLNAYAYTNGDPVNNTDPNGLLTLIVGGFQIDPGSLSDASFGAPGTDFNKVVSAYFGEDAQTFTWEGAFILDGANLLTDFISNYHFADGEKLNIVAHSWGGELAKLFTWTSVHKIDTLITMGTPQREDIRINMAGVGNYFNVYSKFDLVQKAGGPWWCGGILGFFQIGSCAERTDACAINIGIDWTQETGNVSHTDLHTVGVWDAMEAWLARAGYPQNAVDLNQNYCQQNYGTPHPSASALLDLPSRPNSN